MEAVGLWLHIQMLFFVMPKIGSIAIKVREFFIVWHLCLLLYALLVTWSFLDESQSYLK